MEEYINLLLKYDDKNNHERPKDFDHVQASKRVGDVQMEFKEKLNIDFEAMLGGMIQDASFFAQLHVLSTPDNIHHTAEIGISFSSFGDFVSIWGDNADDYPIYKIINILTKHGFVYIPSVVLDTEYSGENQYVHSRMSELGIRCTWACRYFSWL